MRIALHSQFCVLWLAASLGPLPAVAADDSLPDPDALGARALAALRQSPENAALPVVVAALEESGETSPLRAAKFDYDRFSSGCYLEAVEPDSLNFYLQLN